jgi:HEAT repeat protein
MSARPSLALTPAEQQRLVEAQRLAQSGAGGVDSLLSMLNDASWAVRRAVVGALAELGPFSVGPLCATLRTQRDQEARIAATVDALVQNRADVLQEVSELARHADPAVAADAAQILGRRRHSGAVPILSGLVTHADDNVAVAAIEALGRIGGPSAVESLIQAVQSGNFFRVFPAIDVLGRTGDPRAIAPLAALLQQPMYLLESARALGKTAQAAAVAALVPLLSLPSESTQRVGALALAELHARHRERYGSDEAPAAVLRSKASAGVAERLVRGLSNASPEECEAIALILGVIGGDAAASALTGLLDPAEGATAQAAASALERLGRDSELHVAEALRQGSSARRQVLLPIVTSAELSAAVVECLSDPEPRVRSLACEALARTGAAQHASALFARLADESAQVVQAATAAIQALGSVETQRLALQAARDPNPAVRRSSLRILGYFAFPEALPVLTAAVSEPDPRLAEVALSGLAYMELPEALDVLLSAARSPLERTRRASLRALGQGTWKEPSVVERLRAGLEDSDAWTRYYACQAAGRLALAELTPALARLLGDEAGQVRVAAVEALAQLPSEGALEALCRVAEGTDEDLRRAALIGLGIARRPEGLSRLLDATRSADAATRLVAISALAENAGPQGIGALAQAARDEDENVRAAALGFLSTDADPAATDILLELSSVGSDRERFVELLARPSPGRVSALRARLAMADEEQANLCCSLLARLRTPEAAEALLGAIARGSVLTRKAAAVALASLRTPEAVGAVQRAAEHDEDARVRQICSILLSH